MSLFNRFTCRLMFRILIVDIEADTTATFLHGPGC